MSLLMKNVGTKYAFGFDNLHLEIKKKFSLRNVVYGNLYSLYSLGLSLDFFFFF